MRAYTVLAVLTIQAGATLGLTGAQAASRRHALKLVKADPKGNGIYEVLEPTQFKAGETIATDAELNKQLATALEPVETTQERKNAAKKVQGEAKALDALKAELEPLKAKLAAYEALGVNEAADIEALKGKAAGLDSVRAELEAVGLRGPDDLAALVAKGALFDSLPEKVRADAKATKK